MDRTQTEKLKEEKMQEEKFREEKLRTKETQTDETQLERALVVLKNFVGTLALEAGKTAEEGERLWKEIQGSRGLLRELAYYHDYGGFLCEYKVEGYTLAYILVWQVDHFKLYMDRPQEMNRYRQPRLLLEALETMARMEKDPGPLVEKMRCETGQDILG